MHCISLEELYTVLLRSSKTVHCTYVSVPAEVHIVYLIMEPVETLVEKPSNNLINNLARQNHLKPLTKASTKIFDKYPRLLRRNVPAHPEFISDQKRLGKKPSNLNSPQVFLSFPCIFLGPLPCCFGTALYVSTHTARENCTEASSAD